MNGVTIDNSMVLLFRRGGVSQLEAISSYENVCTSTSVVLACQEVSELILQSINTNEGFFTPRPCTSFCQRTDVFLH